MVAGMGAGIGSPPKNTLFAKNVDHNKDTFEWGVYDAIVFVGMALAAAVGGIVAHTFGFKTLFLFATTLNFIGITIYSTYIKPQTHQSNIAKK